jgi:hypothetical protein
MDIVISLAQAAVATFLATELYYITLPGILLFSLVAYAVVTQNPLRLSLPPFIGIGAVWSVIRGNRRAYGDPREITRLSFFGRDAFWVTKEDVMRDLIKSRRVVPVYYGNGEIMTFGDREKRAIDKVYRL